MISGSFAKKLDQYAIAVCGIPSLALMERAAHAVCARAEAVLSGHGDSIIIFCGTGNNGADGLAAGAMLLADGYTDVEAVCCGDPARGSEEFFVQKNRFLAAGGTFKIAESQMLQAMTEDKTAPVLVIDAVFGIGLKRQVTGIFAETVETMNLLRNAGSYVISVDMPSGIDADGGKNLCAPLYPVHADETVTFGYAKTGQYLDYGYGNCGVLHIADIGYPSGLPERLKASEDMCEHSEPSKELHKYTDLPVFRNTEDVFLEHCSAFLHRDARANKGIYKKLLIVAGSKGMAGAAYLSGLAAYRSGVGMVKYFGPEENRVILQQLLPEAMYESWYPEADGQENKEAEKHTGQKEKAQKRHALALDTSETLQKSLDWADIVILGPGLSTDIYAEELVELVLRGISRKKCAGVQKHESTSEKQRNGETAGTSNGKTAGTWEKGVEEGVKLSAVIDADALNILARRPDLWELLDKSMVLTPHVGELARLSGKMASEVKPCLPEAAMELAEKLGVNVAAKDCVTVIAVQNDGENAVGGGRQGKESSRESVRNRVGETAGVCVRDSNRNEKNGRESNDKGENFNFYLNTSGCGAMAKAGSGDVLTGVIAGAYAVTGNLEGALAAGVYLHGLAGECAAVHLGGHSTLARDIAESVGEAIRMAAERLGR